jgi:hypothetical protein
MVCSSHLPNPYCNKKMAIVINSLKLNTAVEGKNRNLQILIKKMSLWNNLYNNVI